MRGWLPHVCVRFFFIFLLYLYCFRDRLVGKQWVVGAWCRKTGEATLISGGGKRGRIYIPMRSECLRHSPTHFAWGCTWPVFSLCPLVPPIIHIYIQRLWSVATAQKDRWRIFHASFISTQAKARYLGISCELKSKGDSLRFAEERGESKNWRWREMHSKWLLYVEELWAPEC
jgi:hypothetical protein